MLVQAYVTDPDADAADNGEWLQRRAFLGPRPGGRLFTLGRKWPRRVNNIWLQNAAFMGVALFSAVVLTSPRVSAVVLLLFVLAAVATALVFERCTFCRYLCPVGGNWSRLLRQT